MFIFHDMKWIYIVRYVTLNLTFKIYSCKRINIICYIITLPDDNYCFISLLVLADLKQRTKVLWWFLKLKNKIITYTMKCNQTYILDDFYQFWLPKLSKHKLAVSKCAGNFLAIHEHQGPCQEIVLGGARLSDATHPRKVLKSLSKYGEI